VGHSVLSLETARLRLRRWRESDAAAFAALNSDPQVMEYFPAVLSEAECAFVLEQIEAGFELNGFGIWALEELDGGRFIGLTGLSVVPFAAAFTPAVEVGWRLVREAWGRGYATEAAAAALGFGFEQAGLAEIVSFTSSTNVRSIAVMERLGMHRDDAGDFAHPQIDAGHVLAPHVLYRLGAEEWRGRSGVRDEDALTARVSRGSGPRR
jgi:RimJ/RimL family protein N-acetyltransferase